MNTRLPVLFTTLATVASVAWASSASAGIIVTVGKFSATADQDDSADGVRPVGRGSGEGVILPDAPTPDPTPSPDVATVGDDGTLDYDGVSDDFGACRGGGDGLRYCDDGYDTGAGPGAGGAGGVDESAFGPDDGDEIVVMGCGAGASSGAPIAGALLLLVGFAWRRRVAAREGA